MNFAFWIKIFICLSWLKYISFIQRILLESHCAVQSNFRKSYGFYKIPVCELFLSQPSVYHPRLNPNHFFFYSFVLRCSFSFRSAEKYPQNWIYYTKDGRDDSVLMVSSQNKTNKNILSLMILHNYFFWEYIF